MLIVEDQAYMRRTLSKFLQSAFPAETIHEAVDGISALAVCRDRRPTVILMDIELPDANGIELTAQIRQLLPESAVIVVTMHTSVEYAQRALAAGAFAFVTKGSVNEDLVPAIKAALARHRPTTERTLKLDPT